MSSNWSYGPETAKRGHDLCDLDLWPLTATLCMDITFVTGNNSIGHLSFVVWSFVQHFIAIGEFKLELQSRNAQFGSNLTIFRAVWPWNLADDLEQGKSEGYDSCDRPSNLTQIGFKSPIFRPCDLEIWWMTPKNNKARLLYYIKLWVSYQIHQWIQTGVTVWKHPIWVKFNDF